MSDLPNCPDCAVEPGMAHDEGCDVARCLFTGWQRLMCGGNHQDMGVAGPPYRVGVAKCGQQVWTGRWPGDAECEEFGWWTVLVAGQGWKRVPAGTPGALHDLNRLVTDARWDHQAGRWVQRLKPQL